VPKTILQQREYLGENDRKWKW